MSKPTIADTGALVGLIYAKDQWHEWTKQQAASLPLPYLTCEAVMVETCFLLQNVTNGEQTILEYIKAGVLQIDFSLAVEVEVIKTLMNKYDSVPMSLADACLVRMSELRDNAQVFTIDGDFRIYRKHGNKQISLVIPDEV